MRKHKCSINIYNITVNFSLSKYHIYHNFQQLLSTVTVFFSFIPFLISPRRAPLPSGGGCPPMCGQVVFEGEAQLRMMLEGRGGAPPGGG